MSNEIKIKGWNSIVGRMSEPMTLQEIYETKGVQWHIIEWLRFTGLKDKNGIDIYEGDFDQDGQVVRWCDNRNGWAMSIYDFPTKEHIACHCYNCEGNYELSEITKEIEIKGNIHELK